MTAGLELSAVRKRFGSVQALDGVDFVATAGEVHGLVGVNGAGKTTLLACAAGMLRPDAGEIRVCGLDARSRRREAAALIGLAAQRTALYSGLSVRTNATFFARAGGASRGHAERSATDLIETLGLGPVADRQVLTLSVGQQRVAHVVCALAHAPRLVLLDEPTAGLDAAARAALAAVLRERAAAGATVVLSTHQLQEIESQCATVTVLDRGRVLASGPVGSLIERFGGSRDVVRTGEPSFENAFLALTSAPGEALGAGA